MKLKAAAKDAQSFTEGIYILGSNQVNGKAYWLHKNGSCALWYENENWNIGGIENLGSDLVAIYSLDDSVAPHKATTWIYHTDDDEWIETNDLVCVKGV